MEKLPIVANICEPDSPDGFSGVFYHVRLHAVPRVGELIDLRSYLEERAGNPPHRHYEVVHVIHHVQDVVEDISVSIPGAHSVEVGVRPYGPGPSAPRLTLVGDK